MSAKTRFFFLNKIKKPSIRFARARTRTHARTHVYVCVLIKKNLFLKGNNN